MNSLVLLRHGIAVEKSDPLSPPDPERPLTVKGANRVERTARGLQAVGVAAQLIMSSPYVRATQTARIVARVLGVPTSRLRQSDALVGDAKPAMLFKELASVAADRVLCIGHQPLIDQAVGALLGEFHPGAFGVKKAGAVEIAVSSLAPPRGRLVWYIPPRILRHFGSI